MVGADTMLNKQLLKNQVSCSVSLILPKPQSFKVFSWRGWGVDIVLEFIEWCCACHQPCLVQISCFLILHTRMVKPQFP